MLTAVATKSAIDATDWAKDGTSDRWEDFMLLVSVSFARSLADAKGRVAAIADRLNSPTRVPETAALTRKILNKQDDEFIGFMGLHTVGVENRCVRKED
ncbi:hypothetical protein [Halomicronema sp. CCY15110]|uniref:hypothetical protein n=1 Tax=Halomicronema sp. CCY15110 TaxID=2767773 RepID=UPI00194FE9A2|nr:hypothetical protein [Halomicronema sp. CCY15110]